MATFSHENKVIRNLAQNLDLPSKSWLWGPNNFLGEYEFRFKYDSFWRNCTDTDSMLEISIRLNWRVGLLAACDIMTLVSSRVGNKAAEALYAIMLFIKGEIGIDELKSNMLAMWSYPMRSDGVHNIARYISSISSMAAGMSLGRILSPDGLSLMTPLVHKMMPSTKKNKWRIIASKIPYPTEDDIANYVLAKAY